MDKAIKETEYIHRRLVTLQTSYLSPAMANNRDTNLRLLPMTPAGKRGSEAGPSSGAPRADVCLSTSSADVATSSDNVEKEQVDPTEDTSMVFLPREGDQFLQEMEEVLRRSSQERFMSTPCKPRHVMKDQKITQLTAELEEAKAQVSFVHGAECTHLDCKRQSGQLNVLDVDFQADKINYTFKMLNKPKDLIQILIERVK